MTTKIDVTVLHQMDDQHIKIDPEDYIDADTKDELKDALIETAEEQVSYDTVIEQSDLDAVWAAIQKLQAEEEEVS